MNVDRTAVASTIPAVATDVEDRKALEALFIDDPDFAHLDDRVDRFNVFEAIGIVRRELRHSDFLTFLFSPEETHGLGDFFLRRFLQTVVRGAPQGYALPFTALDIDLWNLATIEVRREWRNIDILVLLPDYKRAVLIENKIDSWEHSDQLARYHAIVMEEFPGWQILPLFLTPDGEPSSDERYLPITYAVIYDLIHTILDANSASLGADVRVLLDHYADILRRHVMSESEIAALCRSLYQKHRRALDLIFENRPDQQAAIRDLLEGLIGATTSLALDHSSKSYIRFAPKEWDVPTLTAGQGWTRSGRILLFEFQNDEAACKLKLIIGPGPVDSRQRLVEMAKRAAHPFKPSFKKTSDKYSTVLNHTFLSTDAYDNTTYEELETKIRELWDHFLADDLPKVLDTVRAEKWIWNDRGADISSHIEAGPTS